MNGQQAPTGRPTVSARQSVRLEPVHTASMNKNRTVGQISAARTSALTIVSTLLKTPLNSRCRVHPNAPPSYTGGGSGSTMARRI